MCIRVEYKRCTRHSLDVKFAFEKKKGGSAPKLQRMKTRPNRIEAKPPVIAKPAKPNVEFKPPERVASVKPDNDNTIAEAIEAEMVARVKPQGHYELNALMTRAVVAELQDIMIKIWQELPDDPPNEAEKEVVEALRNTAGDDLRNVLGLNITKRLLNVYNPLFVKIQFSGKPVREHLSRFLRKYNFAAFKRIDKVDIFAARMRSINDFDRICIDKNIRCGDIEVTVTPCYRFTKCPPNLKTIFSDSAEFNEETSVKAENIPQGKQNKPIDKTKTLVNPKANVSKATSQNTTPNNVKVETKATPTKTMIAKPSAVAASDTKTATPNLKVIKTEPVGVKVEANPATSTSSTLIKAPSTVKLERNIEAQPNAITAAGKVNSTAATKIKTLSNTVAVKPKSTEVTKQGKGKKAIESQSIKKIGDVTQTSEPGDFDELDDKEILALLSGGIVLDECSGSDEE